MKTKGKLTKMVCVSTLLAPVAGAAVVVELNPVDDAYVNSLDPTGSFGSKGALLVASDQDGKGIFETVLKFDLSEAVEQFDAAYGSGNWSLTGASLRVSGNVATEGAQPNNTAFPTILGGDFTVTWMADDSWSEDSVSHQSLSGLLAGSEGAGTLTYVAPGDDVAVSWELDAGSAFREDVASGGELSLLLSPAGSVAFLINSTEKGSVSPVLSLVASVPEPGFGSFAILGGTLLARRRRAARLSN